jgi:hypothetical protein
MLIRKRKRNEHGNFYLAHYAYDPITIHAQPKTDLWREPDVDNAPTRLISTPIGIKRLYSLILNDQNCHARTQAHLTPCVFHQIHLRRPNL